MSPPAGGGNGTGGGGVGGAGAAAAAAAPLPTCALGDLPVDVMGMVFEHLLRGEVVANASSGTEGGGCVPPHLRCHRELITADAWAAVAPVGAACRRFRSAFLGAIRGLEVCFAVDGAVAVAAAGVAVAEAGDLRVFLQRATGVVAVLPKLPRLCAVSVTYVDDGRQFPAWAAGIVHRLLLGAVAAHPAVRALSLSSTALTPAMLGMLGGAGTSRIEALGLLRMGDADAPATTAAGRTAVVRLLSRLAPTLRVLHWSVQVAEQIGLESDRALSAFLLSVGGLPQLVHLTLSIRRDAVVEENYWTARKQQPVQWRTLVPRLKALVVESWSQRVAQSLANLCRNAPLYRLTLPTEVSSSVAAFGEGLWPASPLASLLREVEGGAQFLPRVVSFRDGVGLGSALRVEGVPLPLWRSALIATFDLTLCGVRCDTDGRGGGGEHPDGPCPPAATLWAFLPELPALRRLTLEGCHLGVPDVMAVRPLPRLRELTLRGCTWEPSGAGAFAFYLARRAPALTALSWVGWREAVDVATALLHADTMPSLVCLRVSATAAGGGGDGGPVRAAVATLRSVRPGLLVHLLER